MYQKTKRVKDDSVIALIRSHACCACNKLPPSDAHHIKTRGSGGGDILSNLMPLDRWHHSELHQIGMEKMVKKYPSILNWFKFTGRVV